jgi:hypothetical protein
VSRAHADMRTIAVALEAYCVDQGSYPVDLDTRPETQQTMWQLTPALTTPISYLPNVDEGAKDLLSRESPHASDPEAMNRARRYRHVAYSLGLSGAGQDFMRAHFSAALATSLITSYRTGAARYGSWRLSSAGPNGRADSVFLTNLLVYDPTNGSASNGDLIRSQSGRL